MSTRYAVKSQHFGDERANLSEGSVIRDACARPCGGRTRLAEGDLNRQRSLVADRSMPEALTPDNDHLNGGDSLRHWGRER